MLFYFDNLIKLKFSLSLMLNEKINLVIVNKLIIVKYKFGFFV